MPILIDIDQSLRLDPVAVNDDLLVGTGLQHVLLPGRERGLALRRAELGQVVAGPAVQIVLRCRREISLRA